MNPVLLTEVTETQPCAVIAHSCHKMKLQEVNGPCISGYSKQLDPVLLTEVDKT